MLYRIGTGIELRPLHGRFPKAVMKHLTHCIEVLDGSYGVDRDYLVSGGYSLIAEDREDVAAVYAVVDLEHDLYEWVERLDGGYLSILYLLNDDFAVVVFVPEEYVPAAILESVEA